MPGSPRAAFTLGLHLTTVPDLAGIGASRPAASGHHRDDGLLPVADGQLTMYWSLPVDQPGGRPADRSRGLAPDRCGAVARSGCHRRSCGVSRSFSRATYRHVALPRWYDGTRRVHRRRGARHQPAARQGANLGLLDAPMRSARAIAERDDLRRRWRCSQRRDGPVRFTARPATLLTPFFQSRSGALGLLRDAFMGLSCHGARNARA